MLPLIFLYPFHFVVRRLTTSRVNNLTPPTERKAIDINIREVHRLLRLRAFTYCALLIPLSKAKRRQLNLNFQFNFS